MLNKSKEEAVVFLLTLSWKLYKLRKKVEEKLIKPLFIERSIIFKKRNDHKFSIKKLNALAWSCLTSKSGGPITPEL